MGKPIRVLLVEDSEDDAFLILRELRRGGFDVDHRRVFTPETLPAALNGGSWDLILSDYHLPQIDFELTLSVWRSAGREIPLIVLSAAASDGQVATTMSEGVHDFVLKSNLKCLCPVVARAIGKAS